MAVLSDLWIRVRSLLRRTRVEAEMDDELRFHLEKQIEKNLKGEMTPAEAKRQARIELGGVEQTKEECRDARGVRFVETLWQDVRFGLRMLRKSPGFAAVAILTLALGIGANTAIFSITYTVLLKPLPLAGASRLVQIWSFHHATPHSFRTVYSSEAELGAIRRRASAFSEVGSYNEGGATLTLNGHPTSVQVSIVSGNFFSVVGVNPLLGRPILPADAQPGHERVAMLSEGFWLREFGGNFAVLGTTIALADISGAGMTDNSSEAAPYTVVGVLRKNFPLLDNAKIFLPAPTGRWNFIQRIAVGRLARGATLAQADAQLSTIASRLSPAASRREEKTALYAESLRSTIARGYRKNLLILFGAVGFLLLLACLNTSNLVLSRASGRRREVALRRALGVTRARLLRQFLVESVLLAFLGGAAGILFALGGIVLIRALAPPYTPRLTEVGLNVPVLIYMLGISSMAGVLLGLAPAFESTRVEPGAALQETGNAFTGFVSRGRRLQQKALVVAEISLALLLATGSMLMVRSLWKLANVDLGYSVDRVLSMWVQFSSPPCSAEQAAHPAINHAKNASGGEVAIVENSQSCRAITQTKMTDVLDRVQGLPGVEQAAFAIWRPLSSIFMYGMQLPNQAGNLPVQYQAVSPGYFGTLGVPLIEGRPFSSADTANSRKVAIVSKDLAKRYFNGHPLGNRLSVGQNKRGQPIWLTVVGEVGNTRDQSPERAYLPAVYVPLDQTRSVPEAVMLVRTSSDPAAISKAASGKIWSVDEGAAISGVSTMKEVLARRYAGPVFRTVLLGGFGLLGLLLAAIGTFGVVSCIVAERTHELAVRVALGADAGQIVRFVLAEGMLLAGVGIAAGVAGALALSRLLRSFLFAVSPSDPASFVWVALLVAGIALLACYIPARRAMRVDPVTALRHE